MTADSDPRPEARPREFAARYSRARPRSLAASRRRPGRKGRIALALAGAVALPAFAAPDEWDRFQIGDAGSDQVVIEPMPFETAGSSFPGSAFYYLNLDDADGIGDGIHSDGDIDHAEDRLDPGPAARSMIIDNSGVDRTRALDCLTAAVYYEAATEPDAGQRAVAQVVLNRVAHPSYPNTVCGVVYQGSQRKTGCQFTFTCDGSLARRPNPMFWLRAENVARAALAGQVFAPVGLATHYHTVQVNPYWAASLHYLGTIGAHRFYRFGGAAGSPATFRFAYLGGEPSTQALKASALASESSAALDPVALQKAFDEGLMQARAANRDAAGPSPAPAYTQELRERGGDTVFRGENLPDATGVKPEFQNSGRWIAQPGT